MKKAKHTINKNLHTKKQKLTSMALVAIFVLVAILVFACDAPSSSGETPTGGGTGGEATCADPIESKTMLVKCIEEAMVEQKNVSTPNLNNIILGAGLKDLSGLFDSFGALASNPPQGFLIADFNGDISKWDTSNVTNMSSMFNSANSFNQNINTKEVTVGDKTYIAWNTSNVTDMNKMFTNARSFKQDIGNWNTSKVENMSSMFFTAADFSQNINTKQVTVGGETYIAWNTSNVTDMSYMFKGAAVFNLPIGNWNTTQVTDMTSMFDGAVVFDQNVNTKDVTVGTEATAISYKAWNVGAVRSTRRMFNGATNFNQDLKGWTWDPAPTYYISVFDMFAGATKMDTANFPKICADATGTEPYPDSGDPRLGGYDSQNCR